MDESMNKETDKEKKRKYTFQFGFSKAYINCLISKNGFIYRWRLVKRRKYNEFTNKRIAVAETIKTCPSAIRVIIFKSYLKKEKKIKKKRLLENGENFTVEDELRAEVERLKAERRWIPVSENLPTDMKMKFLADFSNETMKVAPTYTVGWYDLMTCKWIYQNGVYLTITHWMEIPTESEEE